MQKSRYFLKLAYNGTSFHGWQIQNNAISVQGEIQKALCLLFREDIGVMGCGRTDTGVHASCFYAHFEVNSLPYPEEKLVYKLNALLGKEIAIYSIFKVEEDQHVRFSAIEREYQYFINLRKNPFNSNSWLYVGKPDVALMNHAAKHLLHVSDFGAFCKANGGNLTNICKVLRADWTLKEDQLIFTIRADRFLRNMVRSVVGTLLMVGEGKIDFTEFKNIIQSGNRSLAGESVPAKGLFLTDVKYPFDHE